jgi:epoxyqueuosine reductase
VSSRRIIERALELGFDRAGIIPLQPPQHIDALDQWLDSGFDGEMAYMAKHRDLRADPGALVPGARSIVVVAVNHRPPDDDGEPGGIARYARGADYHKILRKRLARLGRFIDDELGASPTRPRACVDSAPVMERDLAEAAGLGWIGKNTNIISQELGSYLFLGELFVGHDLEPVTTEQPDRCGTCTACIDLCPTGAIVAPYRLDSRLCISYLTIELRGPIPRDLRPLIGDHVFGCDICQIVCPWNGKAPALTNEVFRPREELHGLTAADLLEISDGEFNHLFRGSAVRRTGRVGLARNAAVVLGNSGSDRAIAAVATAIREDPEPLVRGHAAWALGRLGAIRPLETAAASETDAYVQSEIEAAIVC